MALSGISSSPTSAGARWPPCQVGPKAGVSSLGEIQLHADAIGIVKEELRIAGARYDALAEFYVSGLQALAYALDVTRCKGNVVEPAGVLVLLLGAAHHDAVARLACAHQMHGGGAARIEPVAREIERRTIAILQPEHVAIEILGALQIGGFDGVVLQSAKRHGDSPVRRRQGRHRRPSSRRRRF